MNKFLEKMKTKVEIKKIKEVAKEFLFWLWILSVLQLVLFNFDDFDGIPSKVSMIVVIIGLSIYLLYLFFKGYIKIREKIGLYADLNHKMKNIIFDLNIMNFACILGGVALVLFKPEAHSFHSKILSIKSVNSIFSIAGIIILGVMIYTFYTTAKDIYDLYKEAKSRHSQKH